MPNSYADPDTGIVTKFVLNDKTLTKFGFDGNGYLTWYKDRNGNYIKLNVDSTGKVLSVSDCTGRSLNVTYNAILLIQSLVIKFSMVI
jgi:hypothetical protein